MKRINPIPLPKLRTIMAGFGNRVPITASIQYSMLHHIEHIYNYQRRPAPGTLKRAITKPI